MQDTMDGKVAVVTGGASGIGRATVEAMAAAGARVVVADLNGEGAETVADAVNALHPTDGPRAVAATVDITDAAATRSMIATALDAFGRLDVLSCNAGLARFPQAAIEIDEEEFELIFRVNVIGTWLCAKAAVPALRAAGGGSIVITGSVMGERTRPGFAAYASSKAAVNHLARTLALELAQDGIRVNAVAPVATDTAMLPQFLGPEDPERAREAFIGSIPLGRLATPEDIAGATVFLASDAARFLSGVVLPVDGGRSI